MLSPTKFNVHRVFLSFQGDQLRNGFISHLIDAFERQGIKFFIDKDELRGRDMTNLFVRIKECKIALAIFSSRYAESIWCMDELVMMKKRVDRGRLQVIPIFYNVRAGDVREQDGEFGKKFWKVAKASRGDQIKEWKEALECISSKMGISLKDNSSEAEFIKEIVKEVEKVMSTIGGCEDAKDHHHFDLFKDKRRKAYQLFQNTRRIVKKIPISLVQEVKRSKTKKF